MAIEGLDASVYFTLRLPRIRPRTKTALGGVLSPKGRVLRRQTGPGIPAPRFSRREPPINYAIRYLGATRCVKAILALVTRDTQNIDAGSRRSIPRTITGYRTPVEDPGQSAGPKVLDEERKGIQPGTAEHGQLERTMGY